MDKSLKIEVANPVEILQDLDLVQTKFITIWNRLPVSKTENNM